VHVQNKDAPALFRKIPGAVFEAQLDGQVTTLDEAIAYAKKLLSPISQ
jgi:hypothetical protein